VKICGLTRKRDAALAVKLGAWALGVIFAPESPRLVDVEKAAGILAAAPAGVERIGVFINAAAGEITAKVESCGLTAVQLHGDESPEFCREVRRLAGVRVIKAIRVGNAESLNGVVRFDTDYLLLDTYHPGRRGGTGQVFDWNLAAALSEELRTGRLILSGGLNPDNIVEAARAVEPFAFDVSSGVESAAGIKDRARLRRLFDELKRI